MTSLAFILGVLPLVDRSRRRLGQPARDRHRRDGRHDHRDRRWRCFFVPVFFVVVRSLFKGSERQRRMYAHKPMPPGSAPAAGDEGGARPCLSARLLAPAPGRGCARASAAAHMTPNYERPAAPVAAAYPDAAAPAAAPARPPAADIDWQRLLRRRAPEAPDRPGAREQPRPARRRAEHRAGARAVPTSAAPTQLPTRRRRRQRGTRQPDQSAASTSTSTPSAPAVTGLRARLLRPRAQPERRGAGAVPRHRGGAQGGADQPGRRGRERPI